MPFVSILSILLAVPVAGQAAASAPVELEGNWTAKPLVTKGPIPGGTGELLEFGPAYSAEAFLAFWARTGPRADKDWTLFSWREGKLTPILVSEVEFVAPDSRKVKVFHWGVYATPIHAGKRLLYFSPTLPDHVYAWDGEKLIKVLASGDELQFGEGRYLIKRARVLDVGLGGKALVFWDSPKQNIEGWALHDGSSFTPLWKKGDEMPGLPALRIQSVSEGSPARLLEDGSLLGGVQVVDGQKKRLALYRLTAAKAEEIVADGGRRADATIQLGKIFAATPRAFAMNATTTWLSSDTSALYLNERPLLLFSDAGKLRVCPAIPQREMLALGGRSGSRFDQAAFLAVDSPRAMLTVKVARSAGQMVSKYRSYPGLYFWNGEELSSVAWEEAAGLAQAAVVEQLQRSESWRESAISSAAVIGLRPIPGPLGGISVRLPLPRDARHNWYIPANSTDGHLQPPPRFPVTGHNITMADVLAWRSPDEVLAGTEEGFFLLRRTR